MHADLTQMVDWLSLRLCVMNWIFRRAILLTSLFTNTMVKPICVSSAIEWKTRLKKRNAFWERLGISLSLNRLIGGPNEPNFILYHTLRILSIGNLNKILILIFPTIVQYYLLTFLHLYAIILVQGLRKPRSLVSEWVWVAEFSRPKPNFTKPSEAKIIFKKPLTNN